MTDNKNPDVLIVGGGPAGTACALGLARRGLAAMVLERSSYSAPRFTHTKGKLGIDDADSFTAVRVGPGGEDGGGEGGD